MTREKDLGGNQMRAGKEEGTRDPHPSQTTTMTVRKMNSLTCFLESWPIPWDNSRESQRNPLPCSKTKNTKMYACCYWHAWIILAETVGSGRTRHWHNESNTP